MKKKGSLLDLPYVLVILVVIGLVIMFSYFILKEFRDNTSDQLTSPHAQLALNEGLNTLKLFDFFFIMILVGATIGVVIGAFYINSHPAFFWIAVLVLVICGLLGAILSNVFDEVTSDDKLGNTTEEFKIIPYVEGKLPSYVIIIGFLLLVILYAKSGDLGV